MLLMVLSSDWDNHFQIKPSLRSAVHKVHELHLAWITSPFESDFCFESEMKKKLSINAYLKSETLQGEPNIQRMMSWKEMQFSLLAEFEAAFVITLAGQISSHRACVCSLRPQCSDSISLYINNIHVLSHLCTKESAVKPILSLFLYFM